MKVRFSPLIAEASGKAGSIVASRWKGINYLRELVTPANPNSAGTRGQAEHRARAKVMTAWWHDLEAQVQDECDRLASGLAMSGFNAFWGRNLKLISLGTTEDPKAAEDPEFMPVNATILNTTSMSVAAGSGSAEIDVTWVKGEATDTFKAYLISGSVAGDGDIPAAIELAEKDTTAISAQTCTLTMAAGTQWYFIAMMVEDAAVNHRFSIARVDWAQSNAA